MVILGVFVKSRRICLKQGCHLVDERACAPCTDAVHALLYIASLEINDLRVFPAKFDGDIGLWRIVLQCGGHGDHFLDERHAQMLCESQPAGSGNDRRGVKLP